MDIVVSSNTVTVAGNIKSVSDFQQLKSTLDKVTSEHNSITLNITDSISITSSVIGYLNKLVLKDGINMQMNIGNSQLMELLHELSLDSVFKARKV